MNLHLIGTRYKNYRNFKDTFITLSSKYNVEIDDHLTYKDKTNRIQLIISDLKLNKLKVDDSPISYLSVVGRNGTGKSTLLGYEFNELRYQYGEGQSHLKEIISYKVYIDEDTDKLYFYIIENLRKNKGKTIKDYYEIVIYDYNSLNKELTPMVYELTNYKIINYKKNDFIMLNNLSYIYKDWFENRLLDVELLMSIVSKLGFTNNEITLQLKTSEYSVYDGDINNEIENQVIELLSPYAYKFDEESAKMIFKILVLSFFDGRFVVDVTKLSEWIDKDFEEVLKNIKFGDMYLDIFNKFSNILSSQSSRNFSKGGSRPNKFLDKKDGTNLNVLRLPSFRYRIKLSKENEILSTLLEFSKAISKVNNKHYSRLLYQIFEFEIVDCSEGERQVIEFMGKLITGIEDFIRSRITTFDWEKGTIISILLELDEPDEHLHPEWERKFKYVLDSLLKDVVYKYRQYADIRIQVIITTHSPFIVSDFKQNELILLESKENNIIAKRPNRSFFGANIYDILKDTFFLNNSIGEFAKQEIERAINVLQSNDEICLDELARIKLLINEVSDVFIKDTLERLIVNYEVRNAYKVEKDRQ